MGRSSKFFFVIFFLLIAASCSFSYYRLVVLKDYAVFTNPDTIPDSADFIAYLVAKIQNSFK